MFAKIKNKLEVAKDSFNHDRYMKRSHESQWRKKILSDVNDVQNLKYSLLICAADVKCC